MNHPAAEIVAIALRKIRKVANSRKYQALLDECQKFLDNIQQIIPPLAAAGDAAKQLVTANPGLQEALQESAAAVQAPADDAASDDGREDDSKGAGAGSAPDASAPVSRGNSKSLGLTPPSSQLDLQQAASASAAAVKAHFAEEDIAEAASSGLSGEVGAVTPTGASSAGGAPGAPGSSGASTGFVGGPLPDLVPRTEVALPDKVTARIIAIMRMAVDTQRPNVIEIALDCVQKLIAFKFLQGAVYAINLDKPGKEALDAGGGRTGGNGGNWL